MKKDFVYGIASIFLWIIASNAIASTHTEIAGDITQIVLPIAAVTTTGFHKDLTGFKEFAYSYLLTVATVETLKFSIKRERPNGNSQKSFPSGHTANAFVSASYLQIRYGWAYGAPAYAVAAFTGYSRVQAKKHWISDVLAGAAIGTGASYLFTHPYRKQINISPYLNQTNKEGGISIAATIA